MILNHVLVIYIVHCLMCKVIVHIDHLFDVLKKVCRMSKALTCKYDYEGVTVLAQGLHKLKW